MSSTTSDLASTDTIKGDGPLPGGTETDSGKAFAKLLEGFAHAPSESVKSRSALTRSPSSYSKRKLDLSTEIKSGTPFHSPSKRVKKARDENWRELRNVHDYLGPGLDVVFCGINPGQKSASAGRHFANPNNHFWGCLHESGLTNRRVDPSEDDTLPKSFNLGMTNLVQRPTREAAELTPSEMRNEVPMLLSKVAYHKPKIVCFVGVGIADIVTSYLALKKGNGWKKGKGKGGPGLMPFKLVYDSEGDAGAEPGRMSETLFYAVSSTSGRVVAYRKEDKVKQFRAVKELLIQIQNGEYQPSGDMTPVYKRDLEVSWPPCRHALRHTTSPRASPRERCP